jgi:hypothetical protein
MEEFLFLASKQKQHIIKHKLEIGTSEIFFFFFTAFKA